MKDWLPDDDLAHCVIAAAERGSMGAFQVNHRNSGKPQYHPHMVLALLVYAYVNGLFSARRIERATHRDLGVRFVTANTPGSRHPRSVAAAEPAGLRGGVPRHPADGCSRI